MTNSLPRTVIAFLLPALIGCGSGTDANGSGSPSVADASVTGVLRVSAAASLTDVFAEMADTFMARHPEVEVQLNLAGSTTLRTQILEGAPVDVFASADERTMAEVAEAGALSGNPRLFARNSPAVVVPAGNPAGVSGVQDLARPELLVGLCAEAVPCGRLAGKLLDRLGVVPVPDTREPDVRSLLTRVALGELDVAVVYRSDAVAATGEVDVLPLEESRAVVANYPVAVLARSPNPVAARAFVDFVTGNEARAILVRHGFEPA